ncbi:hypothetical protein MBLNU459_g5040t1 [Dothideomycetes sp. NU459]
MDAPKSQPQCSKVVKLSYPAPRVLLVTIDKAEARNAIGLAEHWELDAVFKWYDQQPSLLVAIITGSGDVAFCAGQDLKQQGRLSRDDLLMRVGLPKNGFAGLSQRTGRKPVIAAVNGLALGGGFEICLNCDMVVASPNAAFALPEALRGVYAGAGGLARLTRACGLHLASELILTGKQITVQEAKRLSLVNRISESRESLLQEAVELALEICECSPDSVIVSRAGIRETWENASVERAGQVTADRYSDRLLGSPNLKIGLAAFAKKQKPVWISSNL